MAKVYPEVSELKRKAVENFSKEFGQDATVCVCAPGRVNLIGEHTDYNEGFVLPMVIIISRRKKKKNIFNSSTTFPVNSVVNL